MENGIQFINFGRISCGKFNFNGNISEKEKIKPKDLKCGSKDVRFV